MCSMVIALQVSLDSKIDQKNVGTARHVEMPSNDGIVYLLTMTSNTTGERTGNSTPPRMLATGTNPLVLISG